MSRHAASLVVGFALGGLILVPLSRLCFSSGELQTPVGESSPAYDTCRLDREDVDGVRRTAAATGDMKPPVVSQSEAVGRLAAASPTRSTQASPSSQASQQQQPCACEPYEYRDGGIFSGRAAKIVGPKRYDVSYVERFAAANYRRLWYEPGRPFGAQPWWRYSTDRTSAAGDSTPSTWRVQDASPALGPTQFLVGPDSIPRPSLLVTAGGSLGGVVDPATGVVAYDTGQPVDGSLSVGGTNANGSGIPQSTPTGTADSSIGSSSTSPSGFAAVPANGPNQQVVTASTDAATVEAVVASTVANALGPVRPGATGNMTPLANMPFGDANVTAIADGSAVVQSPVILSAPPSAIDMNETRYGNMTSMASGVTSSAAVPDAITADTQTASMLLADAGGSATAIPVAGMEMPGDGIGGVAVVIPTTGTGGEESGATTGMTGASSGSGHRAPHGGSLSGMSPSGFHGGGLHNGGGGGSADVPEPNALVILGIASALLLRRRGSVKV